MPSEQSDRVSAPRAVTNTDFRTPSRFGLFVLVLLVFGLFGWMAWAPLASAVIANGTIIVRGKPQLVQHLDGGIVKSILVRNGDVVRKGDPLVRLDETTLLANLEIYRNRMREAIARRSRLEAERDDRPEITFDTSQAKSYGLGEETTHHEGQRRLFDARRATRHGQVSQLTEKIGQFKSQIDGVKGLIEAKSTQLGLVSKELVGIQELLSKGIATQTRVMAQERLKADLVGQLAEHNAELGRIQNAIREADVGISQVDRQFKESILTDLRDATNQADELGQQIHATARQLERIEVRAPVNGVVHELQVNTIGGIIPPHSTLMQVIATDEGVEVEVTAEAQWIDQLAFGQQAIVRFPALNQATTPELIGTIEKISPSSVVDEKSGMAFYRLGIGVTAEELGRLGGVRLIPGMPVEAFVQTKERTALNYLLKPVMDNINRAMRER